MRNATRIKRVQMLCLKIHIQGKEARNILQFSKFDFLLDWTYISLQWEIQYENGFANFRGKNITEIRSKIVILNTSCSVIIIILICNRATVPHPCSWPCPRGLNAEVHKFTISPKFDQTKCTKFFQTANNITFMIKILTVYTFQKQSLAT